MGLIKSLGGGRDRVIVDEINRSIQSLGDPHTLFSGFVARLVRQYGAARVLRAAPQTGLTMLQIGWVQRWISDNERGVR